MPFSEEIRVLSLALIRHNDRVFLSQGYDPIKQTYFYRAMGGGIDFGETSLQALKREFYEELRTTITNIKYLGCLENIFTYSGKPGHEIIQLYECDFTDPAFYQFKQITFSEGDRQKTALWVNIEDCKSGELIVVPAEFLNYL